MRIVVKIIILLKWILIFTGMFIGAVMCYVPMFLPGGDPEIQWIGASLLIIGAVYCFYKLSTPKKRKKEKGGQYA